MKNAKEHAEITRFLLCLNGQFISARLISGLDGNHCEEFEFRAGMAALPVPGIYVGCGMWDVVCCMVAGDRDRDGDGMGGWEEEEEEENEGKEEEGEEGEEEEGEEGGGRGTRGI